jgi:hypothetical protein
VAMQAALARTEAEAKTAAVYRNSLIVVTSQNRVPLTEDIFKLFEFRSSGFDDHISRRGRDLVNT